jgi:hypothetical protein
LGFAAYLNECKKSDQHGTEGTYQRVFISGDLSSVPTLIPRKFPKKRLQKKDVLKVGIKVASVGVGEYFGFGLDKPGPFLLGDFTVTHL